MKREERFHKKQSGKVSDELSVLLLFLRPSLHPAPCPAQHPTNSAVPAPGTRGQHHHVLFYSFKQTTYSALVQNTVFRKWFSGVADYYCTAPSARCPYSEQWLGRRAASAVRGRAAIGWRRQLGRALGSRGAAAVSGGSQHLVSI